MRENNSMRQIWGYQPVDYRTWPSLSEPQKQVVTFRPGISSSKIRFCFTNENGVMPLSLRNLRFEIIRQGEILSKGAIRFKGNDSVMMDIGADCSSDVISSAIGSGDLVRVEMILARETYLSSGVVTYSTLDLAVENRSLATDELLNQHDFYKMVQDNPRMTYFFGLCGMMAETGPNQSVVTVFGDSITQQGFMVNHLREDLQKAAPDQYAVVNCGIGGNRVLFDTDPIMDKWLRHGVAGIKRFSTDIFTRNEPDIVFVFHGVNDLIQETAHPGDSENLDQVVDGLKYYAMIIKQHDAKSIIATIPPLGNSRFYSVDVEMKRQKLNSWIRKQHSYDAVVDLDEVAASTKSKMLLNEKYDSGDGLHPSDNGGARLAAEIGKVILKKFGVSPQN